jgi:tetratricopeptide (TPR) repeat protein
MKQLSKVKYTEISKNLEDGKRAIHLSLYDLAEKHFIKVINLNSGHIEARAYLAFVYSAKNEFRKSIQQLKVLLLENINVTQTHHNLGVCYHELKDYKQAIFHYEAALKIDPKRIDTCINCAASYRANQDFEHAIKYLHNTLFLDSKNARAFHLLGVTYTDIRDYARALECLEHAIGLEPKSSIYRLCFASTLEAAGLYPDAENQYHLTCENAPNYFDAFALYGRFLLKGLYHDEALECFFRAKQILPDKVDFYKTIDIDHFIAETYLGMGDTRNAIQVLTSLLDTDTENPTSLELLGQAYQDDGNTNSACEIAERLLNIKDYRHKGLLLLSKVKKSSLEDKLAENLITSVSQINNETDKIRINFAIGKVYNDRKKYDEAFKYYTKANTLANQRVNYSKSEDELRFLTQIEFFNKTLLESKKFVTNENNLPILIVGMPRSGTTLTEQIISSHPLVMGAGEVAFWGGASVSLPIKLKTSAPYPQCILELSQDQAYDISKTYESTLRKITGPSSTPKHITDKMPHNFLNIGLIALLFPDIKIIHTKRNPIDTCLSIFFQSFNPEAHPYAFDLKNIGFHYKQYERIMRHWHQVLPGKILDINYEDTINDPEYWSRTLIDHIGLEWDDACLAPHKLERTVKTASHWQVRQPIYKTSVERWRNYEEYLGPLIDALKD